MFLGAVTTSAFRNWPLENDAVVVIIKVRIIQFFDLFVHRIKKTSSRRLSLSLKFLFIFKNPALRMRES